MTVSFGSACSAQSLRRAALGLSVIVATVAGGCSSDGGINANMFSTGAIGDSKPAVEAKASADPVCVSMATQIDGLRREGSVERLEKAADGKTSVVNVQRSALAKQSQLNKLNADFITKCGPNLPRTAAVAAPVAATPVKPVAAVKTASVAKTVAAKDTSGVTVVPPAATVAAPQ